MNWKIYKTFHHCKKLKEYEFGDIIKDNSNVEKDKILNKNWF